MKNNQATYGGQIQSGRNSNTGMANLSIVTLTEHYFYHTYLTTTLKYCDISLNVCLQKHTTVRLSQFDVIMLKVSYKTLTVGTANITESIRGSIIALAFSQGIKEASIAS